MRNYRGRTILLSVTALLLASPVLAIQLPEQEVKQEVAQEVAPDAAQKVEPAPLEPPTGLEQEPLPVTGELPTDATDPLAEPEEVLKTKTKSNQSND
jgi:hypothetical protein